MAVHRYYRLYITSNNTGGTTDQTVHFLGLELRASISGTNQSITGNGSASASATSGGSAAGAFDGSDATVWRNSVIPCWLQWDFGAGNEKEVLEVAINQGSTDEQRHILRKERHSSILRQWIDLV